MSPRPTTRLTVRVECRAEGRRAETPVAVHVGDRRHEVLEILARHVEADMDPTKPTVRVYRLVLQDLGEVRVDHDVATDGWTLQPGRAGKTVSGTVSSGKGS